MHSCDEYERTDESSENVAILYILFFEEFSECIPFLNAAPWVEAITARCRMITPMFSAMKSKLFLDDEC